ncbi:MAG TPA: alpha/beta hydrolase [Mycobacteriales bacterium]|nr:alpha/beta hydrolase [Mycobacteriales bacterium]
MPLDPATEGLLELLTAGGAAGMSAGTPQQARAVFRTITVDLRRPETLAPVRTVDDVVLPGPAGDLPARVYRPDADGALPTIVFFHGGGFVIGDLDTHDDHARVLAHDVRAVVVSVGYRLAPEHPFPAAFEDCLAATRWAGEHVAELGGDAERLAVAGDSAGGNLAAAVALAAREGGPRLAAQLLIYPACDFRDGDHHASRTENGEGLFLTAADMRWFGEAYVPDSAHREDPRASVLLSPDLRGAAPAVVLTAQYDPLRDEGEAYAHALQQAGVSVDLRRYDGLIHGFFGMGPISPAAARAVRDGCAALRQLLDRRADQVA